MNNFTFQHQKSGNFLAINEKTQSKWNFLSPNYLLSRKLSILKKFPRIHNDFRLPRIDHKITNFHHKNSLSCSAQVEAVREDVTSEAADPLFRFKYESFMPQLFPSIAVLFIIGDWIRACCEPELRRPSPLMSQDDPPTQLSGKSLLKQEISIRNKKLLCRSPFYTFVFILLVVLGKQQNGIVTDLKIAITSYLYQWVQNDAI